MSQPRLGPAKARCTHPIEVLHWYQSLLAGASVVSRTVPLPADGRVHLLEGGERPGPPLVLLHGSGVAAGFFLPLLNELHGVRAIAPDLPGSGLSDPFDRRPHHYFDDSVDWLDRLFDTLGLETVSLVGHSGRRRLGAAVLPRSPGTGRTNGADRNALATGHPLPAAPPVDGRSRVGAVDRARAPQSEAPSCASLPRWAREAALLEVPAPGRHVRCRRAGSGRRCCVPGRGYTH